MSTQTDRIAGLNGGLALKAPVHVATTAAITLSGLQTIDGVSVTAGTRVLVKNQASAVDNGIYEASATAWKRSKDFDGARDVVNGTTVRVVAGTTNGGRAYAVSTSDPVVVGTSEISWSLTTLGSDVTSQAVVEDIATLQLLSGNDNSVVHVLGYYTAGTGAGYYWLDSSDTTTTDETWDSAGRFTVVDSVGGRWKLLCFFGQAPSLDQVGIKKGDDTAAAANAARLQAFFDSAYARRLRGEAGTYHFEGGIVSTLGNKSLIGAGKGVTIFDFGAANSESFLIFDADEFGDISNVELAGFSMQQTGSADVGFQAGLYMRNVRGYIIRDLEVLDAEDFGIWVIDCDDGGISGLRVETLDTDRYDAGGGARVASLDGCSNTVLSNAFGRRCEIGYANSAPDRVKATTFDASSDVNTSTGRITWTGHACSTGTSVLVEAGAGTLPAALTDGGIYWIIAVDANTVALATSHRRALASEAIAIPAAGSGTCSLTANDNSSASARSRGDCTSVTFTCLSLEKFRSHALTNNAADLFELNGIVCRDYEGSITSRVLIQHKHNDDLQTKTCIYRGIRGYNVGAGPGCQEGSKAIFSDIVLDGVQSYGFFNNAGHDIQLRGLTVTNLATDGYAVYLSGADDCIVHGVQSSIASGATGTKGVVLDNSDRTQVDAIALENTHSVGIDISSSCVNTQLGPNINIGSSGLANTSTTTKFPLVAQVEIDLATVGQTRIGVFDRGLWVGRARIAITVAPSSGTPEIRMGTTASTSLIAAQQALSSTSLGAFNELTIASRDGGVTGIYTVNVGVASTGGRAIAFLSGLPRV